MKRAAVFLLLASCTAFESGSSGDAAAPKNTPDSGTNAEGGIHAGPSDAGSDAKVPATLDSGGPPPDTRPLELIELAEWHALAVTQITIPLPVSRSAEDLVVAVVNTDTPPGGATVVPPARWSAVGGAGAGRMVTLVLSRTLDGAEPNEVRASLSAAANASVLVALYRGASGVSSSFNSVTNYTELSLPSPARPAALPNDMLFLVYAGVVSAGEIAFSVPQGFAPSLKYTMTGRAGFGANAKNGDLSGGGGFASALTRTASSSNDATATMVLVKD